MPRRRALTDAQIEALLARPTAEPDLIRYDTLSPADIAAPGPSVIERLVATALLQAERHVERPIDAGLSSQQRDALEALLEIRPDTALSALAWARQAPGGPGHRSMARLVDQLSHLRALAIDPAVLDGVCAGVPSWGGDGAGDDHPPDRRGRGHVRSADRPALPPGGAPGRRGSPGQCPRHP